MTSARDIGVLLTSHIEGDEEQLLSVPLQMSANEAPRGHVDAAAELRQLVSSARQRAVQGPGVAVPFAKARGELEGFLSVRQPRLKLQDVVLARRAQDQLRSVVLEQQERARLREHDKVPTQRLLLVGRRGPAKPCRPRP